MRKLKKANIHTVWMISSWVLIALALISAVLDMIYPGTVTGWVWAVYVAVLVYCNIREDKRANKNLELACEMMDKQQVLISIIGEKNEEIDRLQEIVKLKGGEHEHSEDKPL